MIKYGRYNDVLSLWVTHAPLFTYSFIQQLPENCSELKFIDNTLNQMYRIEILNSGINRCNG